MRLRLIYRERVRVREKRSESPKTLGFWDAWLQIGCKNVLSICYQNDLNMCIGNAAEKSAAFIFGIKIQKNLKCLLARQIEVCRLSSFLT